MNRSIRLCIIGLLFALAGCNAVPGVMASHQAAANGVQMRPSDTMEPMPRVTSAPN